MFHYGYRPHEYYTMFLPRSVPYSRSAYADVSSGFGLPPIQIHNFSSRPFAFVGDETSYPHNISNGRIEYHHFYGVNPLYNMPNWYYPSYNPGPAYDPFLNYREPQAYPKPPVDAWPEGFTMKGELHWGKLERIFGVKRNLPDFVKDDLRRVYGTYPRTFVAITYQNGEYLVKGDPKVGEQEYTVEKKVIRRQPTPTDSEEDISDKQSKRKKKKSRR
ncbi:uncharacterized protein C10orf95 homolog [Spea bombifrons]|uniref:uncharacterized protein C10orf95 homolog n=1 Tax=Spea bombifrons TaxID=233779 RepID=UPI002349D9AF|nr:uncharacterized protein C10orf95 homolog [Spea bombifrons]